jgi:hypothetical protein
MTFSEALELIKKHEHLTRTGWNGKGQYVSLTISKSKRFPDFIYIYTVDGVCVPWFASQTDLLANDWEEVE